MAAGTGLLEWRYRHDALVLAAVVAGRAGIGNALRRIFLRNVRIVLTEMASMVVDDPCAPPEWIGLELRVMAVEAVELHYVAGAALLVGNLVQIEIGALMLLVASRAREAACSHVMGREGGVLRLG
ncbi:hypothetical protein [Hyphomicrobium sp.]|uniref:hypothetical protein n=1 Tax=Hyphomicrobium sp. TaxID=82 RepID=UPI002FDEB20B